LHLIKGMKMCVMIYLYFLFSLDLETLLTCYVWKIYMIIFIIDEG